jgi:hypothetical protein
MSAEDTLGYLSMALSKLDPDEPLTSGLLERLLDEACDQAGREDEMAAMDP